MAQKILLIDNFDSFTYNLYQLVLSMGREVEVIRNNAFGVNEIAGRGYSHILISPGPGTPENEKDFGICRQVILGLGKKTPVLGVCLGHQGIISAFGGKIVRAKKPMHGKTDMIEHNGNGIFKNIKNPLRIMRYHSLIGEESSLPSCLEISARSTSDNAIMAVRHREFPIYGLQFHPESIMAEQGRELVGNFLKI